MQPLDEPRAGKTEADEEEPVPTNSGRLARMYIALRAALHQFAASLHSVPGRLRAGAGWVARSARRPVVLLAVVLVVSSVMGVGAYAASTFYEQYGPPAVPVNVRSWQLRPMTYAASDCRGCHTDQAAQAATNGHRDLLCESCHYPAIDHPGPIAGVVQMLPAASSKDCVACHAEVPGRPSDPAGVELESHYAGTDCVSCHEPHSSSAVEPRPVTHPLANLPACVTCHSPVGLKRFPANHDAAPDERCLACHRPGAGDDD